VYTCWQLLARVGANVGGSAFCAHALAIVGTMVADMGKGGGKVSSRNCLPPCKQCDLS